jgi:hypothetical protein
VSPGAVEKHVPNVFVKLGLSPSDGDNRRVLAVRRYLKALAPAFGASLQSIR